MRRSDQKKDGPWEEVGTQEEGYLNYWGDMNSGVDGRGQNRLERGRRRGHGHSYREGEDNLKGGRAETIEGIQRSRVVLGVVKI